MKINNEGIDKVEYIGDIQENRVGIDAENLGFITSLLTSNLYSNPIESFLRESVSNAYDSHVEAGTDESILLLIQNNEDQCSYTISIRDYGTGLSPERFDKIYRNIGSSTKRESNDYIGFFGIGRFAGLSCADEVNITSYYNGTKYDYIIYKKDNGINIDKINEESTECKNGLDVSVVVNCTKVDIAASIMKLCFFDKLIVHYQASSDDFYSRNLKSTEVEFNKRKIINCKNFSVTKLFSRSTNFFRVGNVLYDVPKSIDEKIVTTDGVIINLPMGSVDITPNREALQFTERTTNIIDECINATNNEIISLITNIPNNNMSLKEYYYAFCSDYYNANIDDNISLYINKSTIKKLGMNQVDINNININNTKPPKNFDRFLYISKYFYINRQLIYGKIRSNEDSINTGRQNKYIKLTDIIYNDYTFVEKCDERTKSITFDYFRENNQGNYIIFKSCSLPILKEEIHKYCSESYLASDDCDLDACIEYLFKIINVLELKNSDVPKEYISKSIKKVEKLDKKVNFYDIPIRIYYEHQYRKYNMSYVMHDIGHPSTRGFVVYSENLIYDKELRELSELLHKIYGENVCVISLSKEYIPLLKNRKKFISIEDFTSHRNNLFSKISTSYVIYSNFKSYTKIDYTMLPIWKEYNVKYKKLAVAAKYYYETSCDYFVNIVETYTKNNWLDNCAINYFSLNNYEKDVLVKWYTALGYKHTIITNMICKKYGIINKIGLKPSNVVSMNFINKL